MRSLGAAGAASGGQRAESNTSCEKEKERIRNEAPLRLNFAHEHPDQDQNGNIVAVAEAWQRAECIASDDPRLKPK